MSEAPEVSTEIVAPARPAIVPGIFEGMPAEEYHATDALSSSGIKHLLRSPLHYRADQDSPSDESTAAMTMGTALHLAVLEPDLFEDGIAVVPSDAPRRPTVAQVSAAKPSAAAMKSIEFWSSFHARAAGRLVLTEEQASIVDAMGRSVRRHPVYQEFMLEGRRELSMFWHDARIGIPCRARFDILRDDGIAFDVKSTRDASAEAFGRQAGSLAYHIQSAYYNNAHEHLLNRSLQAFIFVAVENSPPYACAVYVTQANAMRFGIDQCERAMLLYAEARRSGYWRGYPEGIAPLQIPRWALTVPSPIAL